MKQVITAYGHFLLEGIVLVLLLVLLFCGIRDEEGNVGVFHMAGAGFPLNTRIIRDLRIFGEHTEVKLQRQNRRFPMLQAIFPPARYVLRIVSRYLIMQETSFRFGLTV